ncbi:MAG: hypothetical protein NVS4B7_09310 [Ktedonobacteraceae bacterium]
MKRYNCSSKARPSLEEVQRVRPLAGAWDCPQKSPFPYFAVEGDEEKWRNEKNYANRNFTRKR